MVLATASSRTASTSCRHKRRLAARALPRRAKRMREAASSIAARPSCVVVQAEKGARVIRPAYVRRSREQRIHAAIDLSSPNCNAGGKSVIAAADKPRQRGEFLYPL